MSGFLRLLPRDLHYTAGLTTLGLFDASERLWQEGVGVKSPRYLFQTEGGICNAFCEAFDGSCVLVDYCGLF
jgi:hypothetical protein